MACMTLFAQPMAMATTELVRAVPREAVSRQKYAGATRSTVRMSWVVVTDSEGRKQLRMEWVRNSGT